MAFLAGLFGKSKPSGSKPTLGGVLGQPAVPAPVPAPKYTPYAPMNQGMSYDQQRRYIQGFGNQNGVISGYSVDQTPGAFRQPAATNPVPVPMPVSTAPPAPAQASMPPMPLGIESVLQKWIAGGAKGPITPPGYQFQMTDGRNLADILRR